MSNQNSSNTLNRKMGMIETTTVSVGIVVGVGIVTVGSQCAGIMSGGMILFATLAAMILCVYPCLMYAEMGGALPFAGGTYNFARRAVGKGVASIAAWHYVIAVTGCAAAEGLAFSNYFNGIFSAVGIDFSIDTRILAFILMLVFAVVNYRGIEVSSKLQNGFVFFFWAATLVWMIYMFTSGDSANFLFPGIDKMPTIKTFLQCVVIMWWCYAGFEGSIGMAGEIEYPRINIPRAMIIVPFLLFAINGLFQWYLTALVPIDLQQSVVAASEAPFADGLTAAGYIGIPLMLLCVAISFGADLSTMNPCISVPSRYLLVMAEDGIMPKALAKVHPKYNTPYIAIIVTAVLVFLMILTNSIGFIAIISACSTFWTYCIGFISFWKLRKNEPELKRPYKVKFAKFGFIFSTVCMIILFLSNGVITCLESFSITAACLLYYFIWGRKHMVSAEETNEALDAANALLDIEPPADKKKKMDRTFKIWFGTSIALCVLVVVLFAAYWIM